MDKKTTPMYLSPPKNRSQIQRYTQTKSKGMEKDILYKCNGKKAVVVIHICDKIDIKPKAIVGDKEGYYRMIKGTIQ